MWIRKGNDYRNWNGHDLRTLIHGTFLSIVVLYPISVLLFLKIVCSMSTRVDSISNNNLKRTKIKGKKLSISISRLRRSCCSGCRPKKTAVTVIVFLDCTAQRAQWKQAAISVTHRAVTRSQGNFVVFFAQPVWCNKKRWDINVCRFLLFRLIFFSIR